MELLFVVLIAGALGIGVRYFLRGRDTYGAALLPSISAAFSALVWVALLWGLNWTFDGTWIWVAALIAGPVLAIIVGAILPRRRREADHALLAELSGSKA
jgi:hypothetical protein